MSADMFLPDDWLRERARMFPFLGELLRLVAWLICQVREVLRRVCHRVPARPVSQCWRLRFRVDSCDSSWPAIAARWLAIGPPWDWRLNERGGWRLSASPVTVAFPSRRQLRG